MKTIQRNLTQFITLFSTLAVLLSANAAHAGNPEVYDDSKHRIHFSVSQAAQVDNDIVEIQFQHIAQAATAEQVMQEINEHMQSAMEILNDYQSDDGVKLQIQTSQYRVYPAYNKQQIITHWRGQQSLTITSKNSAGLSKILSRIQPILSYQSTHFRISEHKKQEWISKLTSDALQRYQHQAKKIAHSFGTEQYKLLETNIQSPSYSQPPIQPYLRAAAMAEQAAPVMESGSSELRVRVEGTLQIDNP
ncbi:SIMPL domain-containing protein [Thiomicrorhabdus sp. ZW0627]|uniref:SIMPL domain-containing protein n=1 Tax=Thiomicrorhabdus sp. ZW0627 TaxID=3039774 RepID=UPI0024369867|nr:SIMPL domain-containing protein [Thiomicrorhabdus sp. ZW0627]MDG6774839.1 SIMPL domain-containing protein [Thiomicrorhabdus sp. ZW0627]